MPEPGASAPRLAAAEQRLRAPRAAAIAGILMNVAPQRSARDG